MSSLATRYKGIDVFFTDNAETFDIKFCKACKAKLDVTKNQEGATGYATAISHSPQHKHDILSCPNSGKTWHNQAVAIYQVIQDTPSRHLASLLEAELEQVVKNKEATKETWK